MNQSLQSRQTQIIDETYLKVGGSQIYLYRAIDRRGNLIDVRLSKTRDLEAAEAFFCQAKETVGP